jgi:hypothetical protein
MKTRNELICRMQPKNYGLECYDQRDEKCEKCGWNPEIAEQRRAEHLKRIEERENEND